MRRHGLFDSLLEWVIAWEITKLGEDGSADILIEKEGMTRTLEGSFMSIPVLGL